MNEPTVASGRRRILIATALLGIAGTGLAIRSMAFSEARLVPPFAGAEPPATAATESVVLAGGCFWGVQGVYQHMKGVTSAVSGYAGGDAKSAKYDTIVRGGTGHAESVQVTYDPKQVSLARILQVYFSVVHDPTQLNRQGPDIGTHYRSAIFPASESQAKLAQAYIAQLDKAKVFKSAIVTKIERGKPFYVAEDYHQDYMKRHPTQPYIVINDLPKVEDLKKLFPELYRPEPVLVLKAGARSP